MFTDHRLSTEPVPDLFLEHYRGRKYPDRDKCLAGLALNNASAGLNVQVWSGQAKGGEIWVTPALTGQEIFIYDFGFAVTDLTIAFDNNMQPACCAREEDKDASIFHFRWYDTTQNGFVLFTFADCRDMQVRIDEVRDGYTSKRDLILSYVKNDTLYFRQIRDRFLIEYELGPVHPWQKLYQSGMNIRYRFQWEFVWDPELMREC